ncbi:AAA family ATPase, partial [Streptomyces afghaniensis]|uniref:AAA family ATPase n=1 Tax=Streptomyces afghaniensis TaxID=66865 RepID=UPI003789027E
MDENVLRRHFVAIATALYDDPSYLPLAVGAEVAAMREWLCSPDLGRRAFVPEYPELANNPTKRAVRDALEDPPPSRRWRETDAAVVFVTGHGVTQSGAHWTVLQATEADRLPSTGLRTVDLINWIKDTGIRHLFLVLDQCFAGRTIAEVAAYDEDLPGTWLVLPSATKNQEAVECALTGAVTAFLAELHSREGESYAGPQIPLLDVRVFLDGVQAQLGEGQRLIPLPGSQLSGPHPCLPNPHYRPQDKTPVQARRSDLALPQQDVEAHWEPRSRGGDRAGWLFTGRRKLLKDLIAASTSEPGATLVTGRAGTGKSAVLARLVTLSDPAFRARYRDHLKNVPKALRPPDRAVDVAVLGTGKTAHEVIAQLCTALEVPPPATAGAIASLDEWITSWQQWLATWTTPLTVVVDALDEASEPFAILIGVLARLDPGHQRIRLIVGVRSPGGHDKIPPDARGARRMPLADHAERLLTARRIRVDEAPWWREGDLADYAVSILTTTDNSPYHRHGVDKKVPKSVARVLAARAGTSYLVTRIAAASLAARPDPVDPVDATWLATVDDGILGVFRADLHTHCPEPEDLLRAVHLLRAVAFARGRGLPWRRIWPAFANAVADNLDRTYGDTDIADLLASPLGGYLTTDSADGTTVYRLFHEALRTALRDHWRDLLEVPAPMTAHNESAHIEVRITRRLQAFADEALAQRHPVLPPYLRRHLAEHAHAAGLLDRRILSPCLLPHLDANRLRITTGQEVPDIADGLWSAFRRAAHQWDFDHPARNAIALELHAALLGTPLSEHTTQAGWRVQWAHPTILQGEVLGIHPAPVHAMATAVLPDGRAVAVTGGTDGMVCVWDLASGQPIGEPLPCQRGRVQAVATAVLPHGRTVAVTSSDDGMVRVWDLATGQLTGEPLTGHTDRVTAVGTAVLPNGHPLAVTGSNDRTVRVWDLATGQLVGEFSTRHTGQVEAVAVAVLPDGHPVVVTRGSDGRVRVWGLNGRYRDLDWHANAVSTAVLPDGRPVAVTGHIDGSVRVWDLATRRPVGEPVFSVGDEVCALATLAMPDGRTVAVIAHGGLIEEVRVSDLVTGQPVGAPLAYHDQYLLAVTAAVLPDGRAVAVTSDGYGVVRVWDFPAGQPVGERFPDRLQAVATSVLPDGRTVAVTGYNHGTLQVWDLATGQPVGEPLNNPGFNALAADVLPDGRTVAVTADRLGTLRGWDLTTGRPIGEAVCGLVQRLATSVLPDGRTVAVTTDIHGALWVWDLATGQPVSEPIGRPLNEVQLVHALATGVLPDGRTVAVIGDDHGVSVWDLATGQPVGEPLNGVDRVHALATGVLPDGRT